MTARKEAMTTYQTYEIFSLLNLFAFFLPHKLNLLDFVSTDFFVTCESQVDSLHCSHLFS